MDKISVYLERSILPISNDVSFFIGRLLQKNGNLLKIISSDFGTPENAGDHFCIPMCRASI